MSRSVVPKSRSDKSRTLTTAANSPQPPTVLEIVPGRLTETDWSIMVSVEDGENNVGDIIDDILSQVLDDCYRIYIEKQMLPFTIAQAKDAILQIIEWQFLTSDYGESNLMQEPSWQEDEEPVAFPTDSWAQGAVPVVRPPSSPILEKQESEKAPGDVPYPAGEDGSKISSQAVTTTAVESAGPGRGDNQQGQQAVQDMSPHSRELMGHYQQSEKEPGEPPTPTAVKKKPKFKPHQGPLGSAKLQNITKSLDKMERELFLQQGTKPCPEEPPESPCEVYWMSSYFQNVLKIQNSRLPLNNSMTFDEFGNVTSVQRLKPSRFPRPQVKPRFQLVDVDLEAESRRPLARQAMRPLVFRSGNFGKGSLPVRYNARGVRQKDPENSEGVGTLERTAGRKLVIHSSNAHKQVGGPAAARRLKLGDSCAVSTTPEFMEFVPDGAKDRNDLKCDQYPTYEEEPNTLRPICTASFIPPIPVEKLTRGMVQ